MSLFEQKREYLASLSNDWDNLGGFEVTKNALDQYDLISKALKEPKFITATTSGGIEIEYEDISIEISWKGKIQVYDC